MTDAIEIRGLRVLGTHGALVEEQDRSQPFEIDLIVETSLHGAATADHASAAVDYGPVVASVQELVATAHFQLLETLADAVAGRVLADSRVDAVTVSVRKLRPPIPSDVASVGVRLTRRRGETAAAAS